LIDEGNGDFDIEFRYEAINWTTGDGSGGSNGLGGTVARAGFSAGDGVHFFELPQSGNQSAILGLPTTPAGTLGAQPETGIYIFQVRNGVVLQSTIYDFVFVYNDGKDYYYGTVSDNGSNGYRAGQQISTAFGQYDIYNQEGATSQASGTVFVTYYSHGGLGQASYTPLRDSQGLAAGTNGLGSEADLILGTDGLYHPFSASTEAAISSGLTGSSSTIQTPRPITLAPWQMTGPTGMPRSRIRHPLICLLVTGITRSSARGGPAIRAGR
jgi:hypothetical protein